MTDQIVQEVSDKPVSQVAIAQSTPDFVVTSRRFVRSLRTTLLLMLLSATALTTHSVHAGGNADIGNSVNNFLSNAAGIVNKVAPFIALLAFAGLGIMYAGASIPMIADWKKENPKAAHQVVLGLFFFLIAGAVAGMVTNSISLGQ